jgi:hypothetical protein
MGLAPTRASRKDRDLRLGMSLLSRLPYQVARIDTSVSASLYIAYIQHVASKTRLSPQLSIQHSHIVDLY